MVASGPGGDRGYVRAVRPAGRSHQPGSANLVGHPWRRDAGPWRDFTETHDQRRVRSAVHAAKLMNSIQDVGPAAVRQPIAATPDRQYEDFARHVRSEDR